MPKSIIVEKSELCWISKTPFEILLNPPTSSQVIHHSLSLRDVQIVVEGYHDKLMSLTEKIVEKIVNFQMKEDRFAFVKVSL